MKRGMFAILIITCLIASKEQICIVVRRQHINIQ